MQLATLLRKLAINKIAQYIVPQTALPIHKMAKIGTNEGILWTKTET